MAKNQTQTIWIAIAVVAVVLVATGTINLGGILGDRDTTPDFGVPADHLVEITLNTGDKLATATTAANVSYYIFTSDGTYLLGGETGGAGSDEISLPVNTNYQIIMYRDGQYIPLKTTFNTGTAPVKTLNYDLYAQSNATITGARNPIDFTQNLSTGLGRAVEFEFRVESESSNAAVYKPVVRVEYNQTSVDKVEMIGLSSVPCPGRLTTGAERAQSCYAYSGDMIVHAEGSKLLRGVVTFDSITPASNVDGINIIVLDTGMYQQPAWRTIGISAFREGTENPNTKANIGSSEDSNSVFLQFGG